jgi:pimeloyl-ACP methyl ester carboxylesterase
VKSAFFQLRDVRLHALDFGGDGPPLIMLHSTGFGGWMWKPMVAALAPHFRIIAPEQRGHGDSEKTDAGYDFATLAEDMEQLFEALGLEEVYGVGHSSGGTTLAMNGALHPGRVRRLLLVEPILPRFAQPSPDLGPNPMAERARKRRAGFSSPDEMYQSFRGRPPFDTWQDEALRLYCEEGTLAAEGGVVLKCPPEYEARFYEAVGQFDRLDLIQKAEVQVRTLWGERSNVAPGKSPAPHGFGLPGEARIVKGTTHFIPMERPDVVVDEALEFLREDRA